MTGSPGTEILRRVRFLTDAFAWLGAVTLALQLMVAGLGTLRFVAAALVAVVLATWWLRPGSDSWWVAAVESAAAAATFLVLTDARPVVGFLFGVTVRRALRGREGRVPVKASLALAGYLIGLGVSIVDSPRQAGDGFNVELVLAGLAPVAGMVIGAFTLSETIRAARVAEDACNTVTAVLQASPIGLVVVDQAGAPQLHNHRAAALLNWHGHEPDRTVPCPHEPDITRCGLGCRYTSTTPAELRLNLSDGAARVLALHTAPVEQSSGPDHTVVAVADVSAQAQWEAMLRQRFERDTLTGLASREHLLQLVDQALRDHRLIGLLVIDLDRFKAINDIGGHAQGDRYLASAAERIRGAIEAAAEAVAARLGGDEFAVLAPGHDPVSTRRLGEAVLLALARPLPDHRLGIPASIGTAVADTTRETADTAALLRDADTAMYVAKREGGRRLRMFEREMGEDLLTRQSDTADLLAAIERDELLLHYQPIVDLVTTQAVGVEALVRWQRPDCGLVAPDKFIGLAEETGLIVPLGEQVLHKACTQATRWQAQGRHLGMTVNVSTRQLSTTGFVDSLAKVLADTGMPPDQLTIEVTESVWADETAMRELMHVRDLGLRVALDDFGTGYSSLSYLRRYPFDLVKIDRSFTASIGEPGPADGIVRCIIDMATVLGAHTVAEGVETTEQAAWLRHVGCELAQGYLFGKPATAEQSLPGINN